MPEIILTEVQARILIEAREPVVIRDVADRVRIVSEPPDAEALAEYHREKLAGVEEDGIPSEKVGFYLRALEAERNRLGGSMDEKAVEEFLARLEKVDAA